MRRKARTAGPAVNSSVCRRCDAAVIWVDSVHLRIFPVNAEPDAGGDLVLTDGAPRPMAFPAKGCDEDPRYARHRCN